MMIEMMRRGLMWAINIIALSVAAEAVNNGSTIPQDARFLLAIKQSFHGSSLGDWDERRSDYFCDWTGVTCDQRNRTVVSLNLQNKGLTGSIPPDLGNLKNLATLNLSSNALSGSIPASVFGSALTTLSLDHNNLTGGIPPDLSNCSSLNFLDISYNNLGGSIPGALALLSNLQYLSFHQNNFRGPIPVFLSNCTNLVVLDLCLNYLLIGSIPAELGRLTKLENLCLDATGLTGTIPAGILSNYTRLRILKLGNGNLSGPIPLELGQMRQLEELWMESSHFYGTIPSVLGNISSLRVLALYNNSLTGRIPKSLAQLSRLTGLSISYNLLTGSLPPELSNLSNVQLLRVRSNFLSGSIPSEYGRLTSLAEFAGEKNDFSGGIPAELGNCSSLGLLYLDSNRLSGPIPPALGRLNKLFALHLDHNSLTGTIPENLSGCFRLQDLCLGYNRLEGSIPASLARLRNMVKAFSMPHNRLTGHIPAELGGMTSVTTIDLAGNNFNGTIPSTIGNCVELLQLNLSHNNLQGGIPESLASMITLKDLDVSANDLSGPIPQFLSRMPTLSFLNISYNRLSGPIPFSGVFRNLTADSFIGNVYLCGQIVNASCPGVSSTGLTNATKFAIIFSSFGVVAIMITAGLLFYLSRRHKVVGSDKSHARGVLLEKENTIAVMSWNDLWKATSGFKNENIIGRGTMAAVYRGELPDGRQIAVKIFKDGVCDPMELNDSLIAELGALGMTRHRNLVRILGYCITLQTKALVLEMMPNGSLARHIRDGTLDWEKAVGIAVGVANGLMYLHHECTQPILHCDLKPTNILLDLSFKPAIADFGISKILNYGDTSDGFSTSNALRGSIGYMAPEYASSARITEKVDVYSYGIVLLEMVSGKSPTSEIFSGGLSLPKWAHKLLSQDINPLNDVAVQFLKDETSPLEEIMEMVKLGLLCTSDIPQNRPTMREVVKILEKIHRIQPKRCNSSR